MSTFRSEIMGLAAIWVVLHHYCNNMIVPDGLEFLRKFFNYGNVGVDIFLFVSGIGLYFSFQKPHRLGSFYRKRLQRIIIPYILICVPFYIWYNLYKDNGIGDMLLDITQLSFPLSHMITTWYVPAIIVFYLLFPLIYYVQNKNWGVSRTTVTVLMCGFWAGALLVIKHFSPVVYDNTEIALTRLIIFMLGCYFGKAVYEKRRTEGVVAASVVFIVFYYFVFRETVGLSAYWIRMTYVPFAIALCVVAAFLCGLLRRPDGAGRKVLRFFGERSLEIYLSHILIVYVWYYTVGARSLDKYGALDYVCIVAISLVVSVIIHLLIAKLNGFLDRKWVTK